MRARSLAEMLRDQYAVETRRPLEDVFEEEPVDLTTFIRDKQFLNHPRLSEIQYDVVRHLEQIYYQDLYPDLVENFGKYWEPVRFINDAAVIWGKGSGKDAIARISSARIIYLASCLWSPQRYYGMPENDEIHIINVAPAAPQAYRAFFKPFRTMMDTSPWFKDRSYTTDLSVRFNKHIEAVSGHSDAETQEGLNILLGIADEISAFKSKEEVEKYVTKSGREPSKTSDAILNMLLTSSSTRFPDVYKNLAISYPRFCVTPDTPVLCADLEWRQAGKLAEGEELIAFDEDLKGGKFRTASVTYAGRATKPCMRITTDKGTVVSSHDHKWVVRWNRGTASFRAWRATEDLSVGDTLVFFNHPWEFADNYEAGYVAGAFDGEGCLKLRDPEAHGRGWSYGFAGLTLAQNPGKYLMEFVESWLIQDGFSVGNYGAVGRTNRQLSIRGGIPEMLRLLGTVRPQRLLSNPKLRRLWEGRPLNARFIQRATVTNLEWVGEQEVASLTTSTGTFIAGGMLAHNTGDAIMRLVAEGRADIEKRGVSSRTYVSGPYATWEVNPRISGKAAFQKDYDKDPEMARAKYECQPSLSSNRFFRNEQAVYAAFADKIPPPIQFEYYYGIDEEDSFPQDGPLKEQPGWQVRFHFSDDVYPIMGARYCLHGDMALNRDAAGVAMAHVKRWHSSVGDGVLGSTVHSRMPIVKLDFVDAFKADIAAKPVAREVQIRWYRKLIFALIKRGFNVVRATFDQFQSLDTMQILESRGIESKRVSMDSNDVPWQNLRDVMYEGRLEAYWDSTVVDEVLALTKLSNGKVDHPASFSKDKIDAVCGAVLGATEMGGDEGEHPFRADIDHVDRPDPFSTGYSGWGGSDGDTRVPDFLRSSSPW